MPDPGDIIGSRYQITQELGGGGFGRTYLAKDTQLLNQPLCVVKQLQPRFNSPSIWKDAKERFAKEAIVLQRLGIHSQIPQLFTYLEENKEFYLVQELIEGEELKREVNRQLFDEIQVINLLKDVLEILDFVHQQGVIHRDIKPSNLIRRRQDNKMVLIDFGAVKEITTLSFDPQTQTLMTSVIGTPGYMPPEQQNGRPIYSSDIYALGRTAIYALIGRSPLELEDSLNRELKHWQHIAKVSPKLGAILNKMVRPKYTERYRSAAEVLRDLEPLLKVGQTFGGRYRITRYLGGGIGGQTYLADNLWRQNQSPCVLKELKAENNHPSTLETLERRFSTEVTVLERLGYHNQIPQLWDHFEENQQFYLVQEFIDGEVLSQEIEREKQLSENKVIELLQGVLEILDFVHQHQVIHRDINPCHLIRRNSDRTIVLTDFGLVKEILNEPTDRGQISTSTQPVGTEGYMPPEQKTGRPTFASDIYALGITAIKALTGVHPEKLRINPQTNEINWREGIQINPKLAKILDKMVCLEASKRYQSASKILNDLKGLTQNLPTQNTNSRGLALPTPPVPLLPTLNLKDSKALSLTSQSLSSVKSLLQDTFLTSLSEKVSQFHLGKLKTFKPWYLLGALAGVVTIVGIWELTNPTLRPMIMMFQGEQLLNSGQPEKALPIFQAIIKLKPNHFQALNGQGKSLDKLGRYEDALTAYDKVLNLTSDDSQSWKGKGDLLYQLERYEEALKNYDKALNLMPNEPEILNKKGQALYQLEKFQEALETQEKVLRIQPDNAEALKDQGMALISLQKFDKALASFNQALKKYDQLLKTKSNDANIWIERGNVLSALSRPQEALSSYEKALTINSNSYSAWLNIGKTLFPLGRYQEALEAFDKAIAIKPESYLSWYNRGSLLRDRKKDFPEAIKSFDKALEINPNFYHAWRERGVTLNQTNRYQEALLSFDKALNIQPNDYQSWMNQGIALSSLNRHSEALALLDKAVATKPLDPLLWRNRGLVLEKLGRTQDAMESYQKANKQDLRKSS